MDPPGAIPLTVKAGTAVVLDRRLRHARGDNRSEATRIALFYAYTYRWIRPRGEYPLLLADPDLSPRRRQLLGGAASALGHWQPEAGDVPLRTTVDGAIT